MHSGIGRNFAGAAAIFKHGMHSGIGRNFAGVAGTFVAAETLRQGMHSGIGKKPTVAAVAAGNIRAMARNICFIKVSSSFCRKIWPNDVCRQFDSCKSQRNCGAIRDSLKSEICPNFRNRL